MKIEYVGFKPTKHDNVAKTGIVWNFPGDVHEVPDDKAGQLLLHPDIWRRFDPENPLKRQAKLEPAYVGQPVLVPCAWLLEVKDSTGEVMLGAFLDGQTAMQTAKAEGLVGRLFAVAEIPGTAQPFAFVAQRTKLELDELDPADKDAIEAGQQQAPALPSTPRYAIQVHEGKDPLVLDGMSEVDIRDIAKGLKLNMPKNAKGDELRQAFVDRYAEALASRAAPAPAVN